MWVRMTLICAAVAALSACSAVVPTAQSGDKAAVTASNTYPSEHNQFRELGW